MMKYTDENIPVSCGECDQIFEGVNNIRLHIVEDHPMYSIKEVILYSRVWADDAYDDMAVLQESMK